MNDDEWREFVEEIKANVRPHAGYFAWPTNRDIEEWGVVQSFHESLEAAGEAFFSDFESRGAGNDPPDCQAILENGERLGLEVTELVDGKSIEAAKAGHATNFLPAFTEQYLLDLLAKRISRKDNPAEVKGGPYTQYHLVIHCDEPRVLDYDLIQCVRSHRFSRPQLIDRAFLLLSYDPGVQRCPYIELMWVED